MGKNNINNLEKHVVLKCEACGGLHPEEETEVILIKIVKGKNCALDQAKLLNSVPSAPTLPQQRQPEVRSSSEPVDLMPADVARAVARRQNSIIPPGLRKAFQTPPELQSPS